MEAVEAKQEVEEAVAATTANTDANGAETDAAEDVAAQPNNDTGSSSSSSSAENPHSEVNNVDETAAMNHNETKDLKFFVGGIRPDAWDDDLRKHFGQFGVVKEVQVMKDNVTGRNRGFGFVTMSQETDRDNIYKREHTIKDKKVEVREMQPDGSSNLKRKVFMGGINPAITEAQLERHFKQFGEIEKVTIMRDLEGKSRGFGFVVYVSEATLPEVLKKSIHHIDAENKVEVRAAEARQRGHMASRMAMPPRPPAVRPPYPSPHSPYQGYAGYLSQYFSRAPYYSAPYGAAPAPHASPYYPPPPSPYGHSMGPPAAAASPYLYANYAYAQQSAQAAQAAAAAAQAAQVAGAAGRGGAVVTPAGGPPAAAAAVAGAPAAAVPASVPAGYGAYWGAGSAAAAMAAYTAAAAYGNPYAGTAYDVYGPARGAGAAGGAAGVAAATGAGRGAGRGAHRTGPY